MSVPSVPNSGAPGGPPAPQRSGCITALMVVAGIALLLPGGLCALAFTRVLASGGGELIAIWLMCMLTSAGGIALIIKASR